MYHVEYNKNLAFFDNYTYLFISGSGSCALNKTSRIEYTYKLFIFKVSFYKTYLTADLKNVLITFVSFGLS